MLADIKDIYRSAWLFALACPLLFLVPVLVEFAQHVVELQAGMYASPEAAMAAEADPLRMQFGFAKTLALFLPGYWFVRYVMFDRDPAQARAIEWPAIGLFAVILAVSGLQSWLTIFMPPLTETLGLEGTAATVFTVSQIVLLQLVSFYLCAWIVAWPLGNASIGPIRSIAIMHGNILHALVLFVAAFLPLMAVHYGLSALAILTGGAAADWAVLALDSIVVGYLALTLAGAAAYAARHAAAQKGVSLHPRTTAEI